MLGTIRGALVTAMGIPVSMAIALFGMHLFGVTGDLMSLGAIDFGFLVDGPSSCSRRSSRRPPAGAAVGKARARAYSDVAKVVVKPVAFAVAIIMLVYIPLLTLEGVEGKMSDPWRSPWRARSSAASSTPSSSSLPSSCSSSRLRRGTVRSGSSGSRTATSASSNARSRSAGRSSEPACSRSWAPAPSSPAPAPSSYLGSSRVTRLAMQRAPSVSLEEARRLDLLAEKVVLSFPEAAKALGQSGRAEMALDAVGNNNTDILFPLKPRKTWTSAQPRGPRGRSQAQGQDRDRGSVATFVSVSQPIEDLTNQLIAGSRADVSIKILGSDLDKLVDLEPRRRHRARHPRDRRPQRSSVSSVSRRSRHR